MWKRTADNTPAVPPVHLTDMENQTYSDSTGAQVYATSPSDFPKPVEQPSFMGIPSAPPSEGSTHSLLLKISADVAAIKNRLGI